MKLLPILVAATVLPLALFSAAPTSAASNVAPDAAAYTVDGGHSSVVFRIQHFVAPFWGRFNKVSGTINFDSKAPEKSTVEIAIDTASVDTNDAERDKHLTSQSFFSAKEFPTITFKSNKVVKSGDKLAVSGDMTMHGTTKPVTAEVTIVGEGDTMPQMGYRAGFEATFSIKRSEFGIKEYVPNISDDVKIIVALECAKTK